MNLEKFTDRAKGFLQAAQTVAIRMNHQRISPAHLLKALLEDSEGMASGLIQRAGGDARKAAAEIDAGLAKVAAVTGGGRSRPRPRHDACACSTGRRDRGNQRQLCHRDACCSRLARDHTSAGAGYQAAGLDPQSSNPRSAICAAGAPPTAAGAENAYAMRNYAAISPVRRETASSTRDGRDEKSADIQSSPVGPKTPRDRRAGTQTAIA